MDMFDLASQLFGGRNPSAQGSTITATGSTASADGVAGIVIDADVTPAEGTGEDTDQTVIDVPTSPSVAEGDELVVTLVGEGPLKTPIVMANPGSGDRIQVQVDSAEALAQQAEDVAQEAAAELEQVRQDVADFRDDVATTYATKVERQDGDDAVKTWVTTNYTNSNDLATTYATKTLVSQTKDAIELAASQTYETQSDAAATYATKAALTVGLDGIRTEVAEDYQPKGDYATTASMNSAIQQSASSIESSVAATYETKTDASTTYATKTEVQQTASALDTRITTAQNTADGAYLERTATGTTIDTTGAATIRSLVVEGQSVQDGTPSPSAPVPIVSVESRNLATTEVYRKGYLISANGTETASANQQISAAIPVVSGETYHVSYSCAATFNDASRIGWYTDQMAFISRNNVSKAGGNITAPSNAAYLRYCRGWNAANPSNYIYDIQIERGTTANPYQPYGCVTLVAGSTRTDIDLQGHALRSLPDGTHDEMRVDSLGRVTMTQRVGSVTLDGSETWTLENGGKRVAYQGVTNARNPASTSTIANALCDHFEAETANRTWAGNVGVAIQSRKLHFADGSGTMTVASWTAWLAANPTTVLYPLATPQTIDLGTIDLPAPADTLWLDAALVPTIGATWWTVGGIAGQQALDAEVTERQTLIRQFSGGVLAGYVGNAIAALVNAAGSFDVVRTAWSGGVPSILGTLATFGANLIRIGGEFASSGESSAKVQFFEDNSALTDLTATHYINTTTEPQVSHDLALSSTTTDDELPDGTSRTVTGNVEVWEQIYNDGTNYSDEVTVSLNGATTNRQYNASVGVDVIEASGGQVERTAFAVADNLRLTHGTGSQVTTADVPMEQAIAVLSSPVTLFTGTYAQTHSAAVTLSESAANFSRIEFICENNDGERTSVTVTDPNGKHFNVVMVTIAGPTGTGTYAYIKAKSFSINGTSVTCRTYTYNGQTIYRHGSVTLRNGVAVAATQASEEIGIVKVLGWR